MPGGVGGLLSNGESYPDVCRARHMFLRVNVILPNLASIGYIMQVPNPSRMEAKGIAVSQRGIGDDASGGSGPATAGCREGTG